MANNPVDEQELLEESALARFTELDGDRGTVLDTARLCSALTLPYLLPPDSHKENDSLDNPYQNIGARLVNNLASKITFTLIPPNNPFFRLYPSAGTVATRGLDESTEELDKANQIAVAIENEAQKRIAKESIGVPAIEMMKSLIVTGNTLGVKIKVETPLDKGLKTYRLDNYVAERDYRGNLLDVVTRETVSPNTLDDDLIALLEESGKLPDEVILYTRCVLKKGKWYEYQYLNDKAVEDSMATYTDEDMPYMALRWTAINGHNYGVGLVEQHKSDLITLEGAYQLLLESASVSARTLFGLRAGALTDLHDLQEADNGSFIFGDLEEDVSVLRVEKHNDIAIVENIIQMLTKRLEQVFLASSSAVRDSERTKHTWFDIIILNNLEGSRVNQKEAI